MSAVVDDQLLVITLRTIHVGAFVILSLMVCGIFGFGHQPKQSSVQLPTINTPPGLSNSKLDARGGGSMSGSRKYKASVVGCINSVMRVSVMFGCVAKGFVKFCYAAYNIA